MVDDARTLAPPRLNADKLRGLKAKDLLKRFDKRPVVRGVSLNASGSDQKDHKETLNGANR